MPYESGKQRRRSLRLRGYDYSQAGAYFVTLGTPNRECLFGDIVHGEMVLNDAGRMVQAIWDELPPNYPGIGIDAFVIMPNHIHGIITIQPHHVGATPRACPDDAARPPHTGQPRGVAPTINDTSHLAQTGRGVTPTTLALPDVVHRFKTLTTKRYTDGVRHNGWKPFSGKLWQRNYWEHVVRDERELHRMRQYIINNPTKWEFDRLNNLPADSADRIRERTPEYALEEWMI